ncbi:hypothetical protein [Bacillus sp. FJAT-27245]|uniref:hypothetical protein n=1 Tax=Bacillus sp. FJAT-27245 TaxID=1684144 RepID=UPI0006A7781E|nr:hypothetical protein [Bacillus sp. FJAT-27245]
MDFRIFTRTSLAFFKLFFKNAISYKVSFVWTLLLPTIIMSYSARAWFAAKPGIEEFVPMYSFYLGFIVTITTANGIGIGLLNLREYGFLKMFKFIAGNKYSVITGFFLSQFSFLMLNIALFSVITSLFFAPHLFLHIVLISLLIGLVTILPVAFLFSWIPALNLKAESLTPITTLLPIVLSYLSMLTLDKNETGLVALALLNPVEFVARMARNLFAIAGYESHATPPVLFLAIILLFSSLGFITLRRIGIVSKIARN